MAYLIRDSRSHKQITSESEVTQVSSVRKAVYAKNENFCLLFV